MRYVSTFSGVEAATVAWEPLGWEPLAFCEVDAFPSAVLAERFPGVPNLGDVREVDWSGTADLVVGGSPCQSFSVAGKREGMAGASGLMLEYVRCVREVRPRWLVWENVPGALSVERGEAFRCLLSALDELGYGLAWRVLDAQFFGVAQRRRRVFVIGHLGDGRAADVLFELEGLRGDHPSSREKRAQLARAAGIGAAGACWGIAGNVVNRAEANGGHQLGVVNPDENGMFTCTTADRYAVAFAANQRGEVRLQGGDGDVFGALPTAWSGKQAQGVAYGMAYKAGAKAQAYPFDEELHPTLSVSRHDASCLCMASGQANAEIGRDVANAQAARQHKDPQIVSDGCVMRRLTPRECERLQGFPDNWTRIPWRGRPAEESPDAPRYKAMGNSMAVPVMRWIGERIERVENETRKD